MKKVYLKPGREKSLINRHPWLYSGAIGRVDGQPENGETVQVLTREGNPLGFGSYSHLSQIRVRMWNWNCGEEINDPFFSKKIDESISLREKFIPESETNAVRLIYAESDGIPGFIADRYGDILVVQFLSAGAEYWKELLVDRLIARTGFEKVYERSDVDVRRIEGLPEINQPFRNRAFEKQVEIFENGVVYKVDIEKGQKTGFYIDQRYNRQLVRKLSKGREVLNCFSYTGGFSIQALAGSATYVLSIDTSAEALAMGKYHVERNQLDANRSDWLEGDVFHVLRLFRDQGRQFDMVILDPPKFAPTVAQVEKATRGYKDINLLAMKLLRAGGILVTFSCSGGISADLFQKILFGAAVDAEVDMEILYQLHQGIDHPISLTFPESEYLKGYICYKK